MCPAFLGNQDVYLGWLTQGIHIGKLPSFLVGAVKGEAIMPTGSYAGNPMFQDSSQDL